MSAHGEWLANSGAQSDRFNNHAANRHIRSPSSPTSSPYSEPTSYWSRLIEPSIFVPFLVLVASILFSANILDVVVATLSALIPDGLREHLWDIIVSIAPASLLFAIDDWISPFPLPHQPPNRLTPSAAHDAKSAVLARILGLGPGGRRFNPIKGGSGSISSRSGTSGGGGGLFASVTQAGKSGLSRLMPKPDLDRPAGLGNISNSCYQNSVLQALSALEPVRQFLSRVADEETAGHLPPVQTAHTLDALVRTLSGPSGNGETLWTPAVLKRMNTFQQQDAQEYFTKLLSEVEEEVEKALKVVRSKPGLESNLSLNLGLQEPSVLGLQPKELDQVDGSALLKNESPTYSGSRNSSSSSLFSNDSGYNSASVSSSPSAASQAAAIAAAFRIPLEGLLAQRIVCQSCGYSSGISMSPFYSLTVNPDVGSTEYYLEETLDNFTAVENIEGVQCASCTLLKFQRLIKTIIARFEESEAKAAAEKTEKAEKSDGEAPEDAAPAKNTIPYERLAAVEQALEDEDFEEKTLSEKCKIPDKQRVQSTKSRQVGIARAPASIAFHINRSRFDERTGYTFKNPAAIRFPLHLDLGPWCLGSAASAASRLSILSSLSGSNKKGMDDESTAPGDDAEQWQLPAQLPMVSGSQHNPRLEGPFYELRAVITHYGQHENGHYICYRKHPKVKGDEPPTPADNFSIDKTDDSETPATATDAEDGRSSLADDEVTLRATSEDIADDNATIVDEDAAEDDRNNNVNNRLSVGPYDSSSPKDEQEDDDGQWWRLSDQNVYPSDEATVLSQGGVFMLFYDRVDARSVLRPPGRGAKQMMDASGSYAMDTEEDTFYSFPADNVAGDAQAKDGDRSTNSSGDMSSDEAMSDRSMSSVDSSPSSPSTEGPRTPDKVPLSVKSTVVDEGPIPLMAAEA